MNFYRRIILLLTGIMVVIAGLLGIQQFSDREVLAGASPAVIDPASIGFGGMNRSDNGFNLTQNWRRYGNVTFTITLRDGKTLEVVPWHNRGDQCLMYGTGNGLHSCQSTSGANAMFATANLSNQTFCQVTDEASQVMLSDAFYSRNATRLDNWINTIEAINCGRDGNLTEWVTGIYYNSSGGHYVVSCDQVSDSASDADAHFIVGLAIINTSEYATGATRARAGTLLGKMCYGLATRNFLAVGTNTIGHRINPGDSVSYIPCGGINVCTSPTNLELTYPAYNGPLLEALAACNAYLGDNSTTNYTMLADDLIQAHLQASNWTGNAFSVGNGRAYHWVNYTSGTAYTVCDKGCNNTPGGQTYTEDPDAMRAPRICNGAAVWRDLRNVTLRNITTYCQQWHNLVGETGTTHVIERYFDGSAKSSTTDGGYKAMGLGAFMNSLVNTSLADNRIDQYNTHLSWSNGRGTMDSQACFGVYDKAFGIMAMGFLTGVGDAAFTGNGTVGGGGGGGGGGGIVSNITITNEFLNDTEINISGVVKFNVTVNTTMGDINRVLAEMVYPTGTRTNLTMVRLSVTTPGGVGNDSNLIANHTFESGDHSWTGYGSRLTESGDTYINVTSSATMYSPNLSLRTNRIIQNNFTSNMTIASYSNYSKVHFMSDCNSASGPRIIYEYDSTVGGVQLYRVKHEGGAYCVAHTFDTRYPHIVQIFADNTNNKTTFKVFNASTGSQLGSTCTANSYITSPTSTADCMSIQGGTQGSAGYFKLYNVVTWNGTGPAGDGGSGINTTTNLSSFEYNFSDTSIAGAYQVSRYWANSTVGDVNNKTVLLNFTVASNSTTPIAWSQLVGNTTQSHNVTFFGDANATSQNASTCAVMPQGYTINNTNLFNATHQFNDGLIVNNSNYNASGQYGGAFRFDGVNDYLRIENSSDLQITGNMTMLAWVKLDALPSSIGRTYHVLSKEQDNVSGYSMWIWHSDDSPHCTAWGLSAPGQIGTSANVPLSSWTHIACRYNGTNFTTFLNCLPQIDEESNGSINPSSVPLMIGQRPDGQEDFNGSIDEVRLFNRALSDTEICQEMNSRRPLTKNGLLLSYSFDEYNSTHVYDTEMVVNQTQGYFDNRTGEFEFSTNISKTGFYSVNVSATDTCSNVISQNMLLNITNAMPRNISASITGGLIQGQTLRGLCEVSDLDNDLVYVNYTVYANASMLTNGSAGPFTNGTFNVVNWTASINTNFTLLCRVNDTLLQSQGINTTVGPVLSSGNGTINIATCQNMTSVVFAINRTYYNISTRRYVAPWDVSFLPVNTSACGFVYNLTLNATSNVTQTLRALTNYSVPNSSMTCYGITLNSTARTITNISTNQSLFVNCSINLTNTPVFNLSFRDMAINWSVV